MGGVCIVSISLNICEPYINQTYILASAALKFYVGMIIKS